MESIGERLRIIRKTEKLTLEDFGKRLGAKKSTISQLENGKNNLTEQMKDYGVDYFRVDTVKHVDSTTWAALKNSTTEEILPLTKLVAWSLKSKSRSASI